MWHESWHAIKGKAITLASIRKRLGKGVTADAASAARKALGIEAAYRHGRYEYTPEQSEAMIQHLRSKQ